MEVMEIKEMKETKTREKKVWKKKMRARVLAGALSFVMAAGLIVIPEGNAATADAAANKGAVVYADLNEVTHEDDWEKKENNVVSFCEWGTDNVTLTADTTLSYKIYMPKTVFGKKRSPEDTPESISINYCVNVHDEDWNYMGEIRSTVGLGIDKGEDGEFSINSIYIEDSVNENWDAWETNKADTSWATISEKGDFYVLTVDGCPLGDDLLDTDKNELVELDLSKTYNINESFDIFPENGTGGEGVFILDDVVVKNSTGVIWSQDFESDDEVAGKCVPGDNRDGDWPAIKGESYTTTILSLKSNKASLKAGKKAKIKATAFNGMEVTYKSNKPKVASVDKKGNVKALKKGKAVISVSCCGKTLKYTVKVSK